MLSLFCRRRVSQEVIEKRAELKKRAQRGNISAKEEGNQLLKSISHPKQLVEYYARQKAKNNVGLFDGSIWSSSSEKTT